MAAIVLFLAFCEDESSDQVQIEMVEELQIVRMYAYGPVPE